MLLRLLMPDLVSTAAGVGGDHQHIRSGSITAVNGVPELVAWQLVKVGGASLDLTETLHAAGVLDGDLLELRHAAQPRSVPTAGTARDWVEDLVDNQARFWTDQTSRVFAHCAVLVVIAGLFVPVSQLPLGLGLAGLAGTLSMSLSVLAATMSRRSAPVCANIALLVGGAWAFLAGTSAFVSQFSDRAGSARTTVAVLAELFGRSVPATGLTDIPMVAVHAVAVGSLTALLLVAFSMASQPAALTHTTAITVITSALLVLVVAVRLDLPAFETANILALCAVLAMGGLPRAALLAGGLTNARQSGEPAAFDERFTRSDRILTGSVVGVSVIAGAVAALGSFTGDWVQQLFAGGIGLLLLLRSRAFSQVPHAIGPRVAGLLVLAALWVASYRNTSHFGQGLLLAVATGVVAVAMISAGRIPTQSPVGRARMSRLLSVSEQLLVVMLVVLAAGAGSIFDWTSRVMG